MQIFSNTFLSGFFLVKLIFLAPKRLYFDLFRHRFNKNGSKWMILCPIAWFFDDVQMHIFSKSLFILILGENNMFCPQNASFCFCFKASIDQEWLKVDVLSHIGWFHDAFQIQIFSNTFLGQNHLFGAKSAFFRSFKASLDRIAWFQKLIWPIWGLNNWIFQF